MPKESEPCANSPQKITRKNVSNCPTLFLGKPGPDLGMFLPSHSHLHPITLQIDCSDQSLTQMPDQGTAVYLRAISWAAGSSLQMGSSCISLHPHAPESLNNLTKEVYFSKQRRNTKSPYISQNITNFETLRQVTTFPMSGLERNLNLEEHDFLLTLSCGRETLQV